MPHMPAPPTMTLARPYPVPPCRGGNAGGNPAFPHPPVT